MPLDISQVMGKLSGISKICGDSSLGVSLVTSAVKDALSLTENKGNKTYLADDIIILEKDNYLKQQTMSIRTRKYQLMSHRSNE
ncbi:hypothetical protein [Enterobacter sp. CPE_E222]|uniref:hypothetical protein n=1 Tax=Enterobacter sp. CPE_E222 TaxID=3383890 RepID=UPI0039760317